MNKDYYGFSSIGDKMQSPNNYATKDDIKNLRDELKNDLRSFATKDDLKKFATKDDLKKFATKDDLDKVAAQVATNTVEILGLKDEMKKVNNKLDYLVEAVTDMAGDLKNNRTERAAVSSALDRHEERLENHETRIKSLES